MALLPLDRTPGEMPSARRLRARRSGRISALGFLAVTVVALASQEATGPGSLAASRFPSHFKVLFRKRDYEIVYQPPGKGKFLPRIQLRKTPPKPVSFVSASGSVEGGLGKDITGFPFTTQNAASMKVGFGAIAGKLQLSVQDPPATVDADDAQRVLEATYEQSAGDLGDVALKVRSNGEWGASIAQEVEAIGRVRGTINSQMDWSLDLDQAYPAFKGFAPSATYGVTQDGMHAMAKVDGVLRKGMRATYAVENHPGKYNFGDLMHNGKLTLTTGSGKHSLEAKGNYDVKLSKLPVRGSLTYTARTRPMTLEASVDFDRYRLRGQSRFGQVSAALGRAAGDGSSGLGGRPAEVELKMGKVAAQARWGPGEPRLRFDVAL